MQQTGATPCSDWFDVGGPHYLFLFFSSFIYNAWDAIGTRPLAYEN